MRFSPTLGCRAQQSPACRLRRTVGGPPSRPRTGRRPWRRHSRQPMAPPLLVTIATQRSGTKFSALPQWRAVLRSFGEALKPPPPESPSPPSCPLVRRAPGFSSAAPRSRRCWTASSTASPRAPGGGAHRAFRRHVQQSRRLLGHLSCRSRAAAAARCARAARPRRRVIHLVRDSLADCVATDDRRTARGYHRQDELSTARKPCGCAWTCAPQAEIGRSSRRGTSSATPSAACRISGTGLSGLHRRRRLSDAAASAIARQTGVRAPGRACDAAPTAPDKERVVENWAGCGTGTGIGAGTAPPLGPSGQGPYRRHEPLKPPSLADDLSSRGEGHRAQVGVAAARETKDPYRVTKSWPV